jgi:hypothetical protein
VKTSFCEQKEAKKLHMLGAGDGPRAQVMKVFLLLFLQKQKGLLP